MIRTDAVLESVLPVYLLILAGAVLRKTKIIRKEHDAGILQLIFLAMMPCFILDKILGSASLKSSSVVFWSIFLGFSMIIVGIGIGLAVGRLLRLERGSGMRTFALSSGCQNFGFFAAPVAENLWGSGVLAVLFVHNIGVEIAVWTVGVMMMSGEKGIPWRSLLNGPVVAVAIGLTLITLGLDDHVTGSFRSAMSLIGVGAFPMAILITGCSMMDLVVQERPSWKIAGGATVVRLFLVPFAILCAAKFLPLTDPLRQVLVVQAAMPAGMTAILLARMYGGRPAVAVQVVIATTVVSLFTLPWIISWGTDWVGLKPVLPWQPTRLSMDP